MANIRINQLPEELAPIATDVLPVDSTLGGTTRKVPLPNLADIIRPVASEPEAEAGADNTKTMTPLRVKESITVNAEQGNFTPQSPFIATRTLGEKAGEVISIRDVGAPTTSGGQPDYTSVLANNEANLSFKTVEIPDPVIRLTGISLTANNLKLRGKDGGQTVIYNPDSTDTLVLEDSGFCRLVDLSFQRDGSATDGRGLVLKGASSANKMDNLFVVGNPGGGIAFEGDIANQQSENQLLNSLVIDNEGGGLTLTYSQDFGIVNNRFGRQTSGPYPVHGTRLDNCGMGTYTQNKHWDQVNAFLSYDGIGLRIFGNRFEQSRNENVIFDGGYENLFEMNHSHTASRSSSGTYSNIKLVDLLASKFLGNGLFSENDALWQVLNGFDISNSCSDLDIQFNRIANFTNVAINSGAATRISREGNTGDTYAMYRVLRGASISEFATRVDNPTTVDWAQVIDDRLIAGGIRVRLISSRVGSGSGGQLLVQIADSSGTLQTRFILAQDGNVALPGLPTAATGLGSGYLWRDGAGSNVIKQVP